MNKWSGEPQLEIKEGCVHGTDAPAPRKLMDCFLLNDLKLCLF